METRQEINQDLAMQFIKAGKATLTIQSRDTGKHFTFKFVTPKKENNSKDIPTWVRLLTSSDNTGAYTYIGTIFGSKYFHGKRSSISEQAQAVQSFIWWFKSVAAQDKKRLSRIALFHEGACLCCGRKLTTPESIQSGIGPVCAPKFEASLI